MHLAVRRERASLWRTLNDAQDEPFSTVAEKLRRWRAMADQVTPFRFFAGILGPDGGRRAFRARLGGEADDVLDTFLSQALAYENVEPPSLQGFVRFIRANESDIKREAEEGASGVRVMTVHGAKGLEADVVFLADTGGQIVVPGQRDILVAIGKDRDDPAFLWRRVAKRSAGRAAERRHDRGCGKGARISAAALCRDDARSRRSLCRRREDSAAPAVLLVHAGQGRAAAEGRKRRVRRGGRAQKPVPMAAAAAPAACRADRKPLRRPPRGRRSRIGCTALRRVRRRRRGRSGPRSASASPIRFPPAHRCERPTRRRSLAVEPFTCCCSFSHRCRSRHAGQRPIACSPANSRMLRTSPRLSRREAEAVLAHPELASLFAGESRAEVAIVGNVATTKGEYAVSGRIDRLLRDQAGWHLVDFKTDRSLPASLAEIDPAYVLQLALYRRLLMDIEPGVPVNATLVLHGRTERHANSGRVDGKSPGRLGDSRQSRSLTRPRHLPTFHSTIPQEQPP